MSSPRDAVNPAPGADWPEWAGPDAQIERGVVDAVLAGEPPRIVVRLTAGAGCEACGARAFCVSDDSDRRRLVARTHPPLPHPGDTVRVAVRGGRVLAAGLWAYGLPLAGLCTGTVGAWALLAGTPHRELAASVVGLVGAALPLAALWRRSRSSPPEYWLDARVIEVTPAGTSQPVVIVDR
jgi:positive regulator of sigma E activity